MPLPGACTRNASAVDPSRITRCGKSGQCSEPSNSRMRDGCFASAAFPEPAEGHVTVRQRMLTAGARLEEQSLRQEPDIPPMTCEHKQLEFCMPDDPLGEFVVSIDTAHVRRPRAISKLPWRAEGADRPPGQYFASAKYQIPEMRR